jgi:tRNA pseudouridine55 synthase
MATGVLVLLFGEATKLSAALCTTEKLYHARIVFGCSTDTDDAQGKPIDIARSTPNLPENPMLIDALNAERVRTLQIPPRFSAISKDGRRLHHAARRGVDVERAPRCVKVHNLRVLQVGIGYLDIEVRSSKGYYVRALARDLGSAIDCPAHLGSLRRTQVGAFGVSMATKWPPNARLPLISLIEAASLAVPLFELTEEGMHRARYGQLLTLADFVQRPVPTKEGGTMGWMFKGQLVALGHWRDESTLRVTRGFCSGPQVPKGQNISA